MSEIGKIVDVRHDFRGSTIAGYAAGVLGVTLEDPDDFDPDGGQVELPGAQVVDYTLNEATSALTFSAAAIEPAEDGEFLYVWPRTAERYAEVDVGAGTSGGVLARIPSSLKREIGGGIRSPLSVELVRVLEVAPGEWEVVDVLGSPAPSTAFDDVDWTNEHGRRLIGGSPGENVPSSVFGSAVTLPNYFGSADGPWTGLSIPNSGFRRVGLSGSGSDVISGILLDYPAVVFVDALLSVKNETATACNTRLFAVITADGVDLPGVGVPHHTAADDDANNRWRLLHAMRRAVIDASPEAPVALEFAWGLRQDSGTASRAMTAGFGKLKAQITYAPDAVDPDRPVVWAPDASTAAAYHNLEGTN